MLIIVELCLIVYCYGSIPIIISTWGSEDFQKANENAVKALSGGRLHALVEGLSTCERLQCDFTVGYGGSPDETGETTLDAMVMDGAGIRIGAVANLHRIKDAARLALAVMNYTKHTMLVGEAATKFAIEMGFKEQNLSTTFSSEMFSEWKRNKCQPNFWMNVEPDPTKTCGPYRPQNYRYSSLQRNVEIINRFHHDTLGMVVVDSNGNVSAGTSTNGARFKIPGRVGDSPIPGAGAYAVEGVGGAAATGDGDVIMRFLPSFFVVEQIRLGTKPFKATRKAVNRILEHYPHFQGAVVGVNSNGTYGAACANLGSFMFSIGEHGKTRTELVACINKKNSIKKGKKLNTT